jgi:hypothetical protein
MSDEQEKPAWGWDGAGAHQNNTPPAPPREGPPLPYVTRRPKRRRKGQLNDGAWAAGCGPNIK